MPYRRSLAIAIAVTATACLALPISLTSYVGSHALPATFPVMKSFGPTPDFIATPISDRMAQAVQQFKLLQA